MKDSGLREVEVEGLGSGGGRQRMRAAAGHGYGITQRTRWTELVDWARTRLSGGRAGRRRQREQRESEKESGGGEAQSVVNSKGDHSWSKAEGLASPSRSPVGPPQKRPWVQVYGADCAAGVAVQGPCTVPRRGGLRAACTCTVPRNNSSRTTGLRAGEWPKAGASEELGCPGSV